MSSTQVFTARESSLSEAQIEQVAKWLQQGEIVALPTETVYGVGVRADSKPANEKLLTLKGRGENHPFTVHLADPEAISALSVEVSVFAQRLMNRYWPGPLTLVLPDRQGGTVGVRVPAKEMTRDILRRVGTPVVLSSANRTGQKPATTAEQVLQYFPQGLQAVVDGGPCALGESSTVVRLGPDSLQLLREGILSLSDLQKAIGKRVLFVCTGNTCRSPMAALLMKKALSKKYHVPIEKLPEFGYRIHSAGISAMQGGPASAHGITAMKELGLDLSKHKSQTLRREQLLETDLVLAMGQTHLQVIHDLSPQTHDRHHLLDPRDQDIVDPYGGTVEDYRKCRDQILRLVEEWAEKI